MKAILAALAMLVTAAGPSTAQAGAKAPVIEVVTLKMKPGVSVERFSQVDRRLQAEYISKQKGFLSRESAPGEGNRWVVIVHWQTLPDAVASMDRFEKAASAATFMSMVEPGTMVMTRYGR